MQERDTRFSDTEEQVAQEPVLDHEPFNRRSLLTKLGGAAVAGVGAAVAGTALQAQPAAAATTLFSSTDGHAVIATSTNQNGAGVLGTNVAEGPSGQRMGVRGEVREDNGSFGVFGVHGTRADSGAAPAGVLGTSEFADGVAGYSRVGAGVRGYSNVGNGGVRGLLGIKPAGGEVWAGVAGESRNDYGVAGMSEWKAGVFARGRDGLVANGLDGYGVTAMGTVAPLRLAPSTASGAPAHAPFHGAVYLTDICDLYVYAGPDPSSAVPTKWRKVLYEGDGSGTTSLLAAPVRFLDTRPGLDSVIHWHEPIAAGQVAHLQVAGGGGVPGIPTGVAGVVGSIAVTGPTNAGHLQLFPGNLDTTSTSVLNFVADQTVANVFVAALSPNGSIKLAALLAPPGGTTHVIIDITGFIY